MTEAVPNGIINLNKPAGLSSARAVAQVKRMLPRGIKIGHAGTLDPFATGVLLLLIGKATRLCERLMNEPKQYEATTKLGATTPTEDPESPETPTPNAIAPTGAQVDSALQNFVGEILQRPSVFSAMKVGGRRAYALARKGQPAELKARPVKVYGIEMIDYAWPLVRLRIDCGRGTYIRAIARDLGESLGTGGYLTQLCRTRVGSFCLKDAVQLEGLSSSTVRQCIQSFPEVNSLTRQ